MVFFSIVIGAVIIAAIAGVVFGLKRGNSIAVSPHIDNTDHVLDNIITKDFQIDYED